MRILAIITDRAVAETIARYVKSRAPPLGLATNRPPGVRVG